MILQQWLGITNPNWRLIPADQSYKKRWWPLTTCDFSHRLIWQLCQSGVRESFNDVITLTKEELQKHTCQLSACNSPWITFITCANEDNVLICKQAIIQCYEQLEGQIRSKGIGSILASEDTSRCSIGISIRYLKIEPMDTKTAPKHKIQQVLLDAPTSQINVLQSTLAKIILHGSQKWRNINIL